MLESSFFQQKQQAFKRQPYFYEMRKHRDLQTEKEHSHALYHTSLLNANPNQLSAICNNEINELLRFLQLQKHLDQHIIDELWLSLRRFATYASSPYSSWYPSACDIQAICDNPENTMSIVNALIWLDENGLSNSDNRNKVRNNKAIGNLLASIYPKWYRFDLRDPISTFLQVVFNLICEYKPIEPSHLENSLPVQLQESSMNQVLNPEPKFTIDVDNLKEFITLFDQMESTYQKKIIPSNYLFHIEDEPGDVSELDDESDPEDEEEIVLGYFETNKNPIDDFKKIITQIGSSSNQKTQLDKRQVFTIAYVLCSGAYITDEEKYMWDRRDQIPHQSLQAIEFVATMRAKCLKLIKQIFDEARVSTLEKMWNHKKASPPFNAQYLNLMLQVPLEYCENFVVGLNQYMGNYLIETYGPRSRIYSVFIPNQIPTPTEVKIIKQNSIDARSVSVALSLRWLAINGLSTSNNRKQITNFATSPEIEPLINIDLGQLASRLKQKIVDDVFETIRTRIKNERMALLMGSHISNSHTTIWAFFGKKPNKPGLSNNALGDIAVLREILDYATPALQ